MNVLICLWFVITGLICICLFYDARASYVVQATTVQDDGQFPGPGELLWTLGDDADTSITFQDIKPEDQVFTISWGDDRSVSLKGDGTVEYLGEYNPTEAAKVFWEAVAKQRCL